jgi:hypothetical protein
VKIGAIVTGHGETYSIPILVRRIAERLGVHDLQVPKPFRISEGKLYKDNDLEWAVRFVVSKVEPDGGVLVVLDADAKGHECPAIEGPKLLARARRCAPSARIEVVLAKQEYEAWFLAAAASIAGKRTLPADLQAPDDSEGIRDAKGWLADRMDRGYSETVDQPAFSALFDLEVAQSRSKSFDKLVRSVAALLRSNDTAE